jgi:hypothetical protein
MSLFSCRVCAEKDKRIADLKEQIVDLKALCSPDNSSLNDEAMTNLEADALMSAHQQIIEIPSFEEQAARAAEQEIRERDRLLNNTY